MEEAGGGEDNIRTRLQFEPVMDSAEAHKMLGVRHLHWGKWKIQRTWRGMRCIMLRLEGDEPTTQNIRRYQAEKLGRPGGNTLLTELMPIPEPKIYRRGYEDLIPQFRSRAEYCQVVKPRRIKLLRGLIEENDPQAIVCYGKGFWNDFRELFKGSEFMETGSFQTAIFGHSLVILAPHFTSIARNGRFDDAVVRILQLQST